MTLNSQSELDNTRQKLSLLEGMLSEATAETEGDPDVRAAEMESLQRQIKQLREDIARFQARQPARR